MTFFNDGRRRIHSSSTENCFAEFPERLKTVLALAHDLFMIVRVSCHSYTESHPKIRRAILRF